MHQPTDYMRQALDLAAQALYLSNPNPRVGCVIVSPGGQVLGSGHTQQVGGAHAEVMALRDAHCQGHDVRGATAFVTLEPCSHHGRTGPCCDALVSAGIGQVVASCTDPNPQVAGRGFARLRAAGVTVTIGPGAQASQELNIGFFSRMQRGTPWVRLKVAASIDGVTALPNGASQWITSDQARNDGHAWRARACAVLTGIGTVLADNPRLDVRAIATPRQPHCVVVDSQLRTPPHAALLQVPQRHCLIYYAGAPSAALLERHAALTSAGAQLIYLPHASGQVDLSAMLEDLGQRHINELHVEAGAQLNGALLQAQAVDEWLLYLAPKLLGQGRGLASMQVLERLQQAVQLQWHAVATVGTDLRLLARNAK